jgi:hypothetical protein
VAMSGLVEVLDSLSIRFDHYVSMEVDPTSEETFPCLSLRTITLVT